MTRTILLLPHPERRERLLAPGAPIAACIGGVWHFGWTVACDGDRLGAHWLDLGTEPVVPDDALLVLARDGAVVPEGSDRLSRVAPLDRTVDIIIGARLRGRRNDGEGELARFGTLVLIDERGAEVSGV